MTATPSRWRQHAINIARQEKIPPNIFLSLIDHESGWRADARSPVGAIGLAQLMPGTARGLGVDPNKPLENLRGGARYLAQQYKAFGKWNLALAAYNAGPGRVRDGSWQSIPETSRYVTNVMNGRFKHHVNAATTAADDPTTPDPTLLPPPPKVVEADLMATSMKALQGISQGKDPTETLSDLVSENETALEAAKTSNAEAAASYAAQVAAQPAPAEVTTRTTTGPASPAGPLRPTSRSWGGSQSIAQQLAKIGWDSGLTTMSEKRDRKSTSSGGVSDHWTGSKNSYAFDLSNGSHPTPEMDAAAKKILAHLGFRWNGRSPVVVTKRVGDFRIQVLYRTQVGGNHDNHIHVGVRRA